MRLDRHHADFTRDVVVATFGIVAVLLAAIGLYGVVAYAVSLDTRAFGVRLALGATASDVSKQVLARSARLAVTGVFAGLWIAFAVAKWTESQFFAVSVTDPVTYLASAAGLFAFALLAGYLPSRKASRISPLTALRSD